MAELPLHLRKLEPLKGALDIIRFLNTRGEKTGSVDDIIDGVGISERSFGKAMRRLVTTGYAQMRSDFVYQLTERGVSAAQELADFDAAGPAADDIGPDKIARQLVIALPRTVVAGKATPMLIGLPADSEQRFEPPADMVLRVSAIYAEIGGIDSEISKLDNQIFRQEWTLTPEAYDQCRIKIQVFQLSAGGDDLNNCGGMYVDVNVTADAEGGMVAYATDLQFDPV